MWNIPRTGVKIEAQKEKIWNLKDDLTVITPKYNKETENEIKKYGEDISDLIFVRAGTPQF